MTLQVSSPGPTTLAPPGWYVVPEDPRYRHSLITGLSVNSLNGWDITKHGWVKAGKKGGIVTASLEQLVQAYNPTVESCAGGQYGGFFTMGTQIDRTMAGQGRIATDVYTFLKRVRVWRRHVEMEHKDSPLLALTLQHRSKVGVVVQYSSSHLADFTGLLYQDRFSNLHLNLSLFQASGTITGVISGSHSSQTILIRLPLHPSNSTQQVKLTATQCRAGQVRVSLRPLSLHNVSITKQLPCVAETMRSFRSVSGRIQPAELDQVEDCISCGRAWLHWLDPHHWLETAWPQSRVVITTTMAVIGILIILITCKFVRDLLRCCGCRSSKR